MKSTDITLLELNKSSRLQELRTEDIVQIDSESCGFKQSNLEYTALHKTEYLSK